MNKSSVYYRRAKLATEIKMHAPKAGTTKAGAKYGPDNSLEDLADILLKDKYTKYRR